METYLKYLMRGSSWVVGRGCGSRDSSRWTASCRAAGTRGSTAFTCWSNCIRHTIIVIVSYLFVNFVICLNYLRTLRTLVIYLNTLMFYALHNCNFKNENTYILAFFLFLLTYISRYFILFRIGILMISIFFLLFIFRLHRMFMNLKVILNDYKRYKNNGFLKAISLFAFS